MVIVLVIYLASYFGCIFLCHAKESNPYLNGIIILLALLPIANTIYTIQNWKVLKDLL